MLIYYLSLIDDPRDDEKFIQIYELYRNSMFNKANSILHNVQDAEDAVQEAFISIAKNIKKVSEPECHKTRRFIVIVITHKAVDIYRKNKNHYTVPLDDIVTCSLDEHAKSSPLADVMEHFVKLPEKYRTPLLLSVDQGYRSKEIAEILGERDDTIRKRLERGTKRLKELYDEAERKSRRGTMLSEQQIEEAIKAVSAAMAADFPEAYEEPVHEFSPEFEKKIEELVRELRERPRRKWLQRAASVAVTIALLGGIWYGIGSEARASIVGWVREQYETFFHYFYEGDSSGPVSEAEYELGWLPDGYEFVDKLEANEWVTLLYISEDNNYLKFSYSKNPGVVGTYLYDEECDTEIITINGLSGEIHLYPDNSLGSDIIWTDNNRIFVITAHENDENLVRMAENIERTA